MPPTDAGPARIADTIAGHLRAIEIDVTDVVVLLRDDVPAVANAVADQFPAVTVHVLGARRDLTDPERAELGDRVRFAPAMSQRLRLDYLMAAPRPQLLVDLGNKKRAHKVGSLRHLLHFVEPGGRYVVGELDAVGDPRYDDGEGETVIDVLGRVVSASTSFAKKAAAEGAAIGELAAATAALTVAGGAAVLERSPVRQWFKLRDWETDATLTARYGDGWGEVVQHRPGFTFTSRAEVTSYGDGPIREGHAELEVPDRFVRRYHGVTCTARQIVSYGDYVLPDSWRHPHQRVLNNRQLVQSTPYFGRHLDRTRPTTTRHEPGAFYYLDTELPGHFGHITTDVVSRVWAWESVKALRPDVRPLISVSSGHPEVPGFQHMIFDALGIGLDDAVVVGPLEAVEVDELYGPTPQFENPTYVDPDLAEVWRALGDNLPPGAPSSADRVFVSRRPSDKRHCHQTEEIEQFFADEGFSIVFPEDLPYPDQKSLFARARVLAGFGGSGMFNMMFAPTAQVILICSSSYNAKNEHLIAAANGNDLHYFWGRAEVPMPSDRFSLEAFTSNFSFDLRGFRRDLRRLVR